MNKLLPPRAVGLVVMMAASNTPKRLTAAGHTRRLMAGSGELLGQVRTSDGNVAEREGRSREPPGGLIKEKRACCEPPRDRVAVKTTQTPFQIGTRGTEQPGCA